MAQVSGQYKTETQLKALTEATSGWSEKDWDFVSGKLPSLKTYKGEPARQIAGTVLCGQSTDHVPCTPAQTNTATDPEAGEVDNDSDGLIEIWTLAQLDHIRHNLAGTSYKNSAGAAGDASGCPDKDHDHDASTPPQPLCHGYELMNDLDFRDASAEGYQKKWVALNNADPTAQGASIVASADGKNPGWPPIGDNSTRTKATRFTGTFEGNHHTIANLYINMDLPSRYVYAGLFGYSEGATMQNMGLTGQHMSVKASNTGILARTYAGGLVGHAAGNGSQMINCYATGNVSTSVAFKSITGGLAGTGFGNIRNCYVTGNVSATYNFFPSSVGGLVGLAGIGGTLSNCYVTGDVSVTVKKNNSPNIGGLVGDARNSIRIINCYTTGDVSAIVNNVPGSSSISGISDVGVTEKISLTAGIATSSSEVSNCYYSGLVKKGTSATIATAPAISTAGRKAGVFKTLADIKALTVQSAGWSELDWDFGTSQQLPTLRKYRERPATQSEGELMCGQSQEHVQCAAPRRPAMPPATTTDPDNSKVDNDGDGLIEVWTLTELNHMRYNLAGTGYRNTEPDWNGADNTFDNSDDEVVVWKANRNYAPGNTSGCPDKDHDNDANTAAVPTCHGYELMADLDFRDASAEGYQKKWVALNNADPTAQGASIVASADGKNPGWPPIGDNSLINPSDRHHSPLRIFTGTFEGNNHTIANLYVNVEKRSGTEIAIAGLFGVVNDATMQNVGLTGEHMFVRASNSNPIFLFGNSYVGGLVGEAKGSGSKIVNCYATGIISNYGSGKSYTGGLAGWGASVVTNCYATGNVSVTDGNFAPVVGGLLGIARIDSTIKNCYATGDVSVTITGRTNFNLGGLIGNGAQSVKIINCYTTGDVSAITPPSTGYPSISGISYLGVDIAVVGPRHLHFIIHDEKLLLFWTCEAWNKCDDSHRPQPSQRRAGEQACSKRWRNSKD